MAVALTAIIVLVSINAISNAIRLDKEYLIAYEYGERKWKDGVEITALGNGKYLLTPTSGGGKSHAIIKINSDYSVVFLVCAW